MVDKSPVQDKILQRELRVWEPKEHRPTLTWSRSGYKPYNTYVGLIISFRMGADKYSESRTSTLHGHPPSRLASRGLISFVSTVHIKDKSMIQVHSPVDWQDAGPKTCAPLGSASD